jgi:CubicO group peptidase (beta-lactamase class C family)
MFHKMQVSKFWWLYLQNDIVACSGELFTTPRTMAKLGYLFLNKGIWRGTRIISEGWINKSIARYVKLPQPHNSTSPAEDYGYSWWIHDYELSEGYTVHSYSARGWGGQKIIVLPHQKTVVVFTQGYYQRFYHQAHHIMVRYILPAILNLA